MDQHKYFLDVASNHIYESQTLSSIYLSFREYVRIAHPLATNSASRTGEALLLCRLKVFPFGRLSPFTESLCMKRGDTSEHSRMAPTSYQ